MKEIWDRFSLIRMAFFGVAVIFRKWPRWVKRLNSYFFFRYTIADCHHMKFCILWNRTWRESSARNLLHYWWIESQTMLMKFLNFICLEIQLCQLSFRLSQREKLLNGKLCTYFDIRLITRLYRLLVQNQN